MFQTQEVHPIEIRERFVTPDLISETPTTSSNPQAVTARSALSTDHSSHNLAIEEATMWDAYTSDEGAWHRVGRTHKQQTEETNPHLLERRSADQWIGTEPRQVIVGAPGTGKSTILRHLVLDLLSLLPVWPEVSQRWGKCLPIWLPFHFFTQRVEDRTGTPASVGEALRAWLEQYDAGQIWPLVEQALHDKRLLLVVDGLDEWINEEAGRFALAALETFAESRSAQVIVSTRPYGLDRLRLSTDWHFRRIAPLTQEQQRQLSSPYFFAIAETENKQLSHGVIERSIDDFILKVHEAPDLRSISATPLFLVFLVGLHLSTRTALPSERFGVYEQAVTLLVADHPANRRTAASVTVPQRSIPDRRLRNVLSRVAFLCQVRGNISTVKESVLHLDLAETLQDPKQCAMSTERSIEVADQLLDDAQGELGLLVRMGQEEFGFLHRMLQEQLAAEYISDQLDFEEKVNLFSSYVGNPAWREVLLCTMWRLTRPAELGELLEIIRSSVGETREGMHAREVLAEVIFGPFVLPAEEVRQCAEVVINAIELHPYMPHRRRLLESVLSGLQNPELGDLVQECLERWTLRTREPYAFLINEVAQLPARECWCDSICRILVRSVCNSSSYIAYSGVEAIVNRFSTGGIGSATEEEYVKAVLKEIVVNPPSGLAQATALTALVIVWRADPFVLKMMHDSREGVEDNLKLVVLGDALGLLKPVVSRVPREVASNALSLSDDECTWLVSQLQTAVSPDLHQGLLIACISDIARNVPNLLQDLLSSIESERGPYNIRLAWSVMLRAFANDQQVVDAVCKELLVGQFSGPSSEGIRSLVEGLQHAYPKDSLFRDRIVATIESRICTMESHKVDFGVYRLAAVDRGPVMRKFLLDKFDDDAGQSDWCTYALVNYFGEDQEVLDALHDVIMGEERRAAKLARVVAKVLPKDQVIPRLLDVLRALCSSGDADVRNLHTVVYAIVRACDEQQISDHPDFEEMAKTALGNLHHLAHEDLHTLRHRLVLGFYPSSASKSVLAELPVAGHLPLDVYLRTFRNDPKVVSQYLNLTLNVFCSLPVYLRTRVCQFLSDRTVATDDLVLRLTGGWTDEISPLNGSLASLTYHQALVRCRQRGEVDDNVWTSTAQDLAVRIESRNFGYRSQQRGALIGMCVCNDFSTIISGDGPLYGIPKVNVSITSRWFVSDVVLLQQVAANWDRLGDEFGKFLFDMLSGVSGRSASHGAIWDGLAAFIRPGTMLERELEREVAAVPDLLREPGVLVWFVGQRSGDPHVAASAIAYHLAHADNYESRVFDLLMSSLSGLGMDKDLLAGFFVDALEQEPDVLSSQVLIGLAMVQPQHLFVRQALEEVRCSTSRHDVQGLASVVMPVHFAVVCAAAPSADVVELIETNLIVLSQQRDAFLDDVFSSHVRFRLKRDPELVKLLHFKVLESDIADCSAALLLALLSDAVGLDDVLLAEVKKRVGAQDGLMVPPVVWDHGVSASLSVRTVLLRITDVVGSEGVA